MTHSSLLFGVATLLLASAACMGEVVDQSSGGQGSGADAGQGSEAVDGAGPPTDGTDTGSTGDGTVHLQCSSASGSCWSDEFPEGESCYECSCRCCVWPDLEEECAADPECAQWLDCMRSCESAEQCGATCTPPCVTGNEPACYLADCHNWICAHACGATF